MNLYLISQKENNDYDTYDSAVVACADEEEARICHPNGYSFWDTDDWAFRCSDGGSRKEGRFSEWAPPDKVTVEYIGEATLGLSGVICSSYNAG